MDYYYLCRAFTTCQDYREFWSPWFSIFHLPIIYSLCPWNLANQFKLLLWNSLGNIQTFQKHLIINVYGKFGRQTKRHNSTHWVKIEKMRYLRKRKRTNNLQSIPDEKISDGHPRYCEGDRKSKSLYLTCLLHSLYWRSNVQLALVTSVLLLMVNCMRHHRADWGYKPLNTKLTLTLTFNSYYTSSLLTLTTNAIILDILTIKIIQWA